MPEFWRRARTSLAFALLVLLATVTMISDRDTLRDGGRELSWFEGVLLDVTVPVQAMLVAPVHALAGVWQGYGCRGSASAVLVLIDVPKGASAPIPETMRARIAPLMAG